MPLGVLAKQPCHLVKLAQKGIFFSAQGRILFPIEGVQDSSFPSLLAGKFQQAVQRFAMPAHTTLWVAPIP